MLGRSATLVLTAGLPGMFSLAVYSFLVSMVTTILFDLLFWLTYLLVLILSSER